MELFCLSAHAAYIRRVAPFLGKMVLRARPKGHSSFFIYSSLPYFLFLSLDLFPFIFLTFFLIFFKDIFNVSEAVGFLVNWLKLAARRFGQKDRAPAPGWERNHSHVEPREGFQLLWCK